MKFYPTRRGPPQFSDLGAAEAARRSGPRPGLAFATGIVIGAALATWAILLFATPLA